MRDIENSHENNSNIRDICTFAVLYSVNRPFCLFTCVYEEHFDFILSYKKGNLRRVESFYGKFVEVIGLRDFCCYLLVCRFVEFDACVIFICLCILLAHFCCEIWF